MMFFKFSFLLLVYTIFISPAYSQTADDVIDKYVQAIGGYDKINSIQTAKIYAKYSRGGMDVKYTETIKKPDKILIEITMQGMTQKRAYDGNTGWTMNPFRGSRDVEKLNEENTKSLIEQAQFEGNLINYKEKGSTVELLGKDDFEGTEVYKINLTDKDGAIHTYNIDANTYLLLKETTKRKIKEKEFKNETIYGDYESDDGILMPHSLEVGSPGRYQEQTIDKVEFNIPVDESIFSMPGNKP
jgi:hypothetical protein